MKKIMFNDSYGLTQAVLEGRKTQTRRIITTNLYNRVDWKAFEEGNYDCMITDDASTATDIREYAAYRVGEEVAVAQSYNDCMLGDAKGTWINYIHSVDPEISYDCDLSLTAGNNNKMFVRASLMPHRIRITNVRIERLQDISDEDCLMEGIISDNGRYIVKTYKGVTSFTTDARLAFKYLICKMCGRGAWDSNPYVFVYDFELIK